MRWRVDSDVFKINRLCSGECSLCILFARMYLHRKVLLQVKNAQQALQQQISADWVVG
jgi:hypothetical protein